MKAYCRKCTANTDRNKDGSCRPCRRASCRRWAAKYPEKVRTRAAARYRKDPQAAKARFQEWYRNNPKIVRETRAAYNAANIDRIKAFTKQYYRKNAVRLRAQALAYHAANRDLALKAMAKRYVKKGRFEKRLQNTGWLQERFDEFWRIQRGRCAICSKKLRPTGQKRDSVAADHCHKTNKPRALLCNGCNIGLGAFNDDIELLFTAVAYLECHNA